MAITFKGLIKTPYIFGNDATTQDLLTIENGLASRKNIIVRRLLVQNDPVAVLTAVTPVLKVSRATNISGGIILEKGSLDTTQTSDANIVFRCQNMETAKITATPGNIFWQQFIPRMHTAVEEQRNTDIKAVPDLCQKTGREFRIRPGESLLLQIVAAAATSNALVTNNYSVIGMWEEEEISVYAISGTVTLNSVPVSGARVIVVEMDDLDGTNSFLREVIITPAGGTWASTIRTGKVGAAFVQYRNGATYYTAPGSPYLS